MNSLQVGVWQLGGTHFRGKHTKKKKRKTIYALNSEKIMKIYFYYLKKKIIFENIKNKKGWGGLSFSIKDMLNT